MAQIPTPPPSRPGSETPDFASKPAGASSELLQSLDTLLEQYLHLLDRQQKLQSGLAKQLSSGFLSLAHANYTCPPGRRYGPDYYDERMKATRKISIHARSEIDESKHTSDEQNETDSCRVDDFEYKFKLETVDNRPTEANTDDTEEKDQSSTEATETEPSANDPAAPASETDAPASQDSDAGPPAPTETKTVRRKFRSDDPIYWYGILVPPSLRAAQKSFTEGIQTQVPDMAAIIVEMQALEQKITLVRRKLGIEDFEQARGDE